MNPAYFRLSREWIYKSRPNLKFKNVRRPAQKILTKRRKRDNIYNILIIFPRKNNGERLIFSGLGPDYFLRRK